MLFYQLGEKLEFVQICLSVMLSELLGWYCGINFAGKIREEMGL